MKYHMDWACSNCCRSNGYDHYYISIPQYLLSMRKI